VLEATTEWGVGKGKTKALEKKILIKYRQGFKFWKKLGGIFSRAVVYLLHRQGNQQSFCCSMTESQQELPNGGNNGY
jgi:hypothetical protein